MSDERYWIWLQLCIGAGKRFSPIIEYFGSAESVYKSNYLQRRACPLIKDKLLERMESTDISKADEIIEVCRNNDWSIITFESEDYPQKLKNIYDPPAVLYVCGELPNLDNMLSIGVVGTRKASPYALNCARIVSKGIARCNGVIISGGALGVDTASHEGALSANGKTIVVLGCGLACNYLSTNNNLRRKASMSGAVISEYPPDTPATRFTFPLRNRIISGLSDGVYVVEASDKSGSLITSSYATDQNRDLFATPASIFDEGFNGTNRLIEDGAIPVTSIKAIVSHYTQKYKTLDASKIASIRELLNDEYADTSIPDELEEQLTFENIGEHRQSRLEIESKSALLKGNEKTVYSVLDDEFTDADTICAKAQLPVHIVLMSLTMLELDGLAEAGIGKRYRRKQS